MRGDFKEEPGRAGDRRRDRAVWRGLFTESINAIRKADPALRNMHSCVVSDIDEAPLSRQEQGKMKRGGETAQ